MTRETHFSQLHTEPTSGILYRRIANSAAPTARLLLLHGVGSNETNLGGLAASLPQHLEILLLRGPIQVGPQGFAWYQVEFTSNGPSFSYEQADTSRRLLKTFIQALEPLPTVIAGFSQGGIMSSSLGLTEPELIAGFGILSGRVLREIDPQIASDERLKSVSAFIAHGHRDAVLPIAWAKEADALFDKIAVNHETHFYDMGHEIIGEELTDFSAWLQRVLPRAE